jgi:hypothetical protein
VRKKVKKILLDISNLFELENTPEIIGNPGVRHPPALRALAASGNSAIACYLGRLCNISYKL